MFPVVLNGPSRVVGCGDDAVQVGEPVPLQNARGALKVSVAQSVQNQRVQLDRSLRQLAAVFTPAGDRWFRLDGSFVACRCTMSQHSPRPFRRAVRRPFVCRELMDVETAQGMLVSHTRDFMCRTVPEARRRWAELLRRIFEADHVIENRGDVPGDKPHCFWLTVADGG